MLKTVRVTLVIALPFAAAQPSRFKTYSLADRMSVSSWDDFDMVKRSREVMGGGASKVRLP